VLSASGSPGTSVVRVLVVPPSDVPGMEIASGCCKLWSRFHMWRCFRRRAACSRMHSQASLLGTSGLKLSVWRWYCDHFLRLSNESYCTICMKIWLENVFVRSLHSREYIISVDRLNHRTASCSWLNWDYERLMHRTSCAMLCS
jgi:hypothetical protein